MNNKKYGIALAPEMTQEEKNKIIDEAMVNDEKMVELLKLKFKVVEL